MAFSAVNAMVVKCPPVCRIHISHTVSRNKAFNDTSPCAVFYSYYNLHLAISHHLCYN